MSVKRNGKYDEGLVDAAWDHAKQCELEYGVQVGVRLELANRKGVWEIILLAQEMRAGPTFGTPLARYKVEYPNSHLATFGGVFLQACMKLDQMVGEVRARQEARPAKR